MLNPIYLDSNKVTIKAFKWAIVGDTGSVTFKDCAVYNLTDIFGVGNEPNLEDCNNIFKFVGTSPNCNFSKTIEV